MKRKAFTVSIILNITLLGILCFGAYYKRTSIINYLTKIYTKPSLQKQIEETGNDFGEFIQEKYEPEIQYISNNNVNGIRIAILGNSLTLIPGWNGGAGLTASDRDHDYVHILLNKISNEKNIDIEYMVLNIAEFERGFETFEFSRLEKIKEFGADITIFQIGENVLTEALDEKGGIFMEKYINLIEYCAGKDSIICLPFWPARKHIQIITDVAIGSASYLVDLSHLGSGIEPLNFAKSEREYENPGVGMHPGDYGMNNIAKILYITANKIME